MRAVFAVLLLIAMASPAFAGEVEAMFGLCVSKDRVRVHCDTENLNEGFCNCFCKKNCTPRRSIVCHANL